MGLANKRVLWSCEEQQVRQELSDCYHLAVKLGWTDSIFTHFTVRVPGEEAFLINAFGLNFEEITPENLVKVNLEGKVLSPEGGLINQAGYTLHSAIHEARPEIMCVLHTHTPYGMAVSMLAEGLLPLSQHSCRYYGRVAYHEYGGILFDREEKANLIRSMDQHKTMILRNHGLVTMGTSIGEAFFLMYNLEISAKTQILALSTGRELIQPSPDVVQFTANQMNHPNHHMIDDLAWQAFRRWLYLDNKVATAKC
ncbi:class II aldolase/adducin family protein [Candidatus Odyssella thessalonicensis]|uniref:class II aldolase/adducin family protein n=1 Tax=Candidatus Odyssella thessalonicensis TaxID=84647 RepID=UPI000225C171|nr:class II aldolase/adducin family protein [Candidatus Odyssella thessalonicensis]